MLKINGVPQGRGVLKQTTGSTNERISKCQCLLSKRITGTIGVQNTSFRIEQQGQSAYSFIVSGNSRTPSGLSHHVRNFERISPQAYGNRRGYGNRRQPQPRGPAKNEQIKAQEVRVIASDKSNLGVMDTKLALSLASEESLDLVLISPDSNPPVCRIVNYGKYLYEEEKKKKEAKKGQSKAKSAVKELKLRPHTDVADYNVKVNQALRFLKKGNKVKITVVFQGRDIAFKDAGRDLLKRFEEDIDENGTVEGRPNIQGRQMFMYLSPVSKKVQA